uniref:Prophenoloxidase II n=1 Tax=Armigeres subalbatus TaxID=124917 RepID=Q9GYX9_ARMSU|nr:prophenoloxidase II [Armigeres subalbatus]
MTANNSQPLQALLQRPLEPTFLPKDNGKTVIDLPDEYLTERYRAIGAELQNRFSNDAEQRIPVRSVSTPALAFANQIDRRGAFSLFNDKHRKRAAGALIALFMRQPDVETLMAVGSYASDRLNPMLFQYSLAVAVQNREDTKDLNIPSLLQLFPDQFVDPATFPRAREEGSVIQASDRMVVNIEPNFTASDREEEQRMAFFREDIGVNSHHWHWHLVYPGDGPDSVVRKDRRGELFYYMHQQLIARYNVDRFCARLSRVRNLSNYRVAVPEGYYPKLIRSVNNRAYPARPQNQILGSVDRVDDNVIFTVTDLERWEKRISSSIDQGLVMGTNGERVMLTEENGTDINGNLMEPNSLSINRQIYGSLHGNVHNVIAYSHDPDNRFLEDYGVMGEVTTAMRDPTFYRCHVQIDDMFRRHKGLLNPYAANQLGNNGIRVQSIGVQLSRRNAPANTLLTYWQRSQIDLAAGLDFGPQGNVFAAFTHLQHAPFNFRVEVNTSGAVRRGTLRIWLGPKTDERGIGLTHQEEQRLMFIELDKFNVTLNPGENSIVRRSDQSSVTIPYEVTFRSIAVASQPVLVVYRFCGCGWPSQLVIPKGLPEGMPFDLFAMLTDYTEDSVEQELDENVDCNDSHSFCGLRDRLYPDRRPMGYPFDRRMPNTIRTLQDFESPNSNMALTNVQVRFTNSVIART